MISSSIAANEMTWVSLGTRLHDAIMAARATIQAIPEEIDLDDEFALVDGASAEACNIAEEIISRGASTTHGRLVTRMAVAWLDGRYPDAA